MKDNIISLCSTVILHTATFTLGGEGANFFTSIVSGSAYTCTVMFYVANSKKVHCSNPGIAASCGVFLGFFLT